MRTDTPPIRDLVLLGGGHSHVQVLKAFAMKPLPGVRLTVVSREVLTPYSGMLPGHVAGIYAQGDMHIDLGPLARLAGARLIADEVMALDLEAGQINLAGHPPLRFDRLSINTGAVPTGVAGSGIPVKPIGRFLPRWQAVRAAARPGETVALIGGGAGGVELALAMAGSVTDGVQILLVTERLLPGQPAEVRRLLERALARSRVRVLTGFRVASATDTQVRSADGRAEQVEYLFWVTGVAAPEWVRGSGLATDEQGFITVARTLQSVSDPRVFAAGDIAHLQDQPRPKAGVFAVRQGPVLADNLRRSIELRGLRSYRAQHRFLTIIGTADGSAVASRGSWAVEGVWVWRWKDWIDRRFMARFTELPEMPDPRSDLPRALRAEAPDAMRCGGCGAKLGAEPLGRALARLPIQTRAHVPMGIGDDAAVLQVAAGQILLTVDGFRSITDDAYLFGRITAHHALNDVFAMGGQGTAALALATVPLMAEAMMEEELFALLKGAVDVLNAHDVPLVGGHSAEGAELSLALTLAGTLDGAPIGKAGVQPGDLLVLTKSIGTGVLLAGDMRGETPSDELQLAFQAMDQSNADALLVLQRHGLHALTDVTGFGLLGHLGEMLRASGCGVRLQMNSVPVLAGAHRLMEAGIFSSLQRNNELALADYELTGCSPADPLIRLLVDPQTSGGLLAALPADSAEACVTELQDSGYPVAAIIAQAVDGDWQIVSG